MLEIISSRVDHGPVPSPFLNLLYAAKVNREISVVEKPS
jgi:hypothetical protein